MSTHAPSADGSTRRRAKWSRTRRGLLLALIAALLTLGVQGAAATVTEPAPAQALPLIGDVCRAIPGANRICSGASDVAADAAAGAANSAFEKIAQSMLSGYGKFLMLSISFWIRTPTGGANESLQKVQDYTFQLQMFFLSCTVIWMGVALLRAKRTALTTGVEEHFTLLSRVVFAVFAFVTVVGVGMQASDAFSSWVLQRALDGNSVQTAIQAFSFQTLGGGFGTAVVFFLALLGFFSSLLLIILLLVRQAMLLVVMAAAPIAAAASGFRVGGESWEKMIGWTIAFLLFKPIGSLVYLIAFTTMGNMQNANATQVLIAMILLGLTVIVLPALMKLVSSAGGGGVSGAAVGGAMIAAGVTAGKLAGMAATGGASGAAGGAGAAGGGMAMGDGVTAGTSAAGGAPGGTASGGSGSGGSPVGTSGGGGGGSDAGTSAASAMNMAAGASSTQAEQSAPVGSSSGSAGVGGSGDGGGQISAPSSGVTADGGVLDGDSEPDLGQWGVPR